jgi:undecaprenyl pyrophosphate phosphatase UppP
MWFGRLRPYLERLARVGRYFRQSFATRKDHGKSEAKMNDNIKARLTFAVTLMVSATLCLSVIGMVSAFLLGLWSKEVDNAEIFKLLSPAFQTIIGGFIGLLAGVKLSHDEEIKHGP